MIPAYFYQTFYLIVVTILTIYMMNRYRCVDVFPQEEDIDNKKLAVALTLFMVIFIGFRPLAGYYFGDTSNYVVEYRVLHFGKEFKFSWDTDNIVFDNLFVWFGAMKIPLSYFFLLISTIYFGGIYVVCRRMFPNDTMLTLLVYLGAFSTYSYATNGIKAGAAASLFLLAIAYKEDKKLAVLFLLLALGFHHSMLAPIGAYVLSCFVEKRQYYLYGWLVCLLMAALHITFFQGLFAGYSDDQGASYLSVTETVKEVSGFRPDFILYSAIPIFLGDYLMRKYEIESETYEFIWKVYVAANGVFLLCTYASYINRIAYLSWLMYPIVLICPFLQEDLMEGQYKYLKYAVYGHLGFTLFMNVVYYGL